MFFVHYDDPQVLHRREDRRPGPQYDPGFPPADPFPFVKPFPFREPAVKDGHQIRIEFSPEFFNGLDRQGDLRHQDDSGLSHHQRFPYSFHIQPGLSAAGDPVDQESPVITLLDRRLDLAKGCFLLVSEPVEPLPVRQDRLVGTPPLFHGPSKDQSLFLRRRHHGIIDAKKPFQIAFQRRSFPQQDLDQFLLSAGTFGIIQKSPGLFRIRDPQLILEFSISRGNEAADRIHIPA